jgi:hypothetical protein
MVHAVESKPYTLLQSQDMILVRVTYGYPALLVNHPDIISPSRLHRSKHRVDQLVLIYRAGHSTSASPTSHPIKTGVVSSDPNLAIRIGIARR